MAIVKNKMIKSNNSVFDSLKLKLKKEKAFDESDIYLRLHRALSWMKAAEEQSGNDDLRFMCLWISFNACYAIDNSMVQAKPSSEKFTIGNFLDKLIANDHTQKINGLLWNRFSSEIRLLLENEFLFEPFWQFHRGEKIDYKKELIQSNEKANYYLSHGKSAELLEIILHRLYVLRNQLFHGGATYKGKVNRKQLKDATQIMFRLVPPTIDIMIDKKEEDWGLAYFPVINRE